MSDAALIAAAGGDTQDIDRAGTRRMGGIAARFFLIGGRNR
jgi:hypothetical protein